MSKKIKLPKGWEEKELSSVVKLSKKDFITGPFGSNLKSSDYTESGNPIIRLQNVNRFKFIDKNIKYVSASKAAELSSHTYQSGDLIITKLGDPLGKSCLVPNNEKFKFGVISSDIVRVRVNEDKYDKRFILYLINSPLVANKLKELTQGTTRPRVKLSDIRKLNVPLPPLPEQQRIVNKLDALFARIDEAIQLVEANLELIPSLKMALLEKAFKGQLFGEVALGKNGLPLGWKKVYWSDILTIKNGKNQKAVIDENGQYPIYGSGGIMAYANDYLCSEYTTIIGRKGTINKPIFVTTKFWNVDTAFGLCPSDKILPKLLYFFCLSFNFLKLNKSTTLPSLSKSNLLKIQTPLPPLAEQNKIVNKLNNLFQNINQLKTENQSKLKHLQDLKKSLLEQAFQGKL